MPEKPLDHHSLLLSPGSQKLPLLLVDTQQPRSTAAQAEKVRLLKTSHPKMTESILGVIDQLTTSALELISSADFDGNGISDALERLGTLICMNHGYAMTLFRPGVKDETIKVYCRRVSKI